MTRGASGVETNVKPLLLFTQRGSLIWSEDDLYIYTVCFFSFVIFYDDITQKVLEIIVFWKKFLKDIGNAFYDV